MESGPSSSFRDVSPDRDDRIRDFLSRHGGPAATPSREGEMQKGLKGWSEIYAMDGYALRCDWSKAGTRYELAYSEVAPSRPP